MCAEGDLRPQPQLQADPCPTRVPLWPLTIISEILEKPRIGLAYERGSLTPQKVVDGMLKEEIYNNERKLNMKANNIEDSNTEENKSGHKSRKTYANATKSNGWYETNKLLFVPTELNEARDEVVVFDEELVELGSKKYKDIVDNGNGNWLFKFNNDVGMNVVANQSPWMVNSMPLMVYKWDPNIGMKKVEHTKLPIWVKLTEVLMEAWTTKGISAIRSSIGRPLIMDNMTTYVCKNGVGRTEYARVLVETDASKGLKELVKLQYRDKNQNKRVRTEEKLANEKVEVTKVPIGQKEDAFIQYNEKERNERLDDLEGIIKDVYEDEFIAARSLVADEVNVKRLRNQLKATKMEVNNAPYDYKIKEVAALTLAEYNEDIEKEGNCVEGPKVADEFVKHFKNFLGLSSLVHHLDSLSNIFTSTLTNSEENEMVTEITDNEIKMFMFGIDDYSVKVIQESLDKFNNVSGLKPNMSKSTIFFGNVKMEDHRKILNVMPFTVVKFHVKYLGVPLITKRLSMEECKQILDKVKNKVDDWKNKFLSYAGRVQLIASILGSMQML
uniref:DUF4283 domain-containing protein n=1 Tax=Tanacetum cinerariifolium TaxID=118510 RepID=A0A6L2NFQ0_TANCI|nr:hypothetical protein [Tanacetum cinerariifolium]